MPYQITLRSTSSLQPQEFSAEAGQTLLQAAQDAGLLLPHSCRDGACGACKGQLLSGSVEHLSYAESALTAAEAASGLALFCRAQPRSDLIAEVRSITRADDHPVRKLPCRVERLERLAPDVMLLEVKLPASEAFRFRAGQYVDFFHDKNQRRAYSIANAPQVEGKLQFHVRRVPDGRFTTHVFEHMKPRDILRFEGPFGDFFLREGSPAPIILLAGGTGFAPLQSLVEDAMARGIQRPMHLYWGSRDRAGLYLDALARDWAARLPWFEYTPVLSDAPATDDWTGRTGWVHAAVIADHADLSGHEVYACGAPAMIDAARTDFSAQCGLKPDAFFSDAFSYALDASP